VTKAEVVATILQNSKNLERAQVVEVLEAFFDVVKTKMSQGENIYIRGFGSFVNKKRARKIAQNITKRQPVVIPEHFVPVFKPAQEFLDKVKELPIENQSEGVVAEKAAKTSIKPGKAAKAVK
jgi:DNA-binding protein HU-beta